MVLVLLGVALSAPAVADPHAQAINLSLSPIGFIERPRLEPIELSLSPLAGFEDAETTALELSLSSLAGFAEPDLTRSEPPFGYVVQGRGAFHADFVIDCEGRDFRSVHTGGGQRWASRSGGRRHSGLDIRIRDKNFLCYGREHAAEIIYVGFSGEQAEVSAHSCGGNAGICVRLTRKLAGRDVETVFAHLKTAFVKPGDTVQPGDVIGIVGRSGRATAPHLHYERHVEGRNVRLERIERKRF